METSTRQLDRLDRNVLHSHVRLGEGVSRYRVESSLEEALRMAELPGEREGRVYFFRRVALNGVTGETNRRVWMERMQQALGSLAAGAVHGSDERAARSNGVYFDSREQALETVLREAIRPRAPEWFAGSVVSLPSGAGSAEVALAVVERMQQSMHPRVAAEIVFAAAKSAGAGAITRLLEAVPDATARAWVRAWETRDSSAGDAVAVRLGEWQTAMLIESARHFGWKEPRAVWLAALAVSCAPMLPASGSVVRPARATLRMLEEQAGGERRQRQSAGDRRVIFDEGSAGARVENSSGAGNEVSGEAGGAKAGYTGLAVPQLGPAEATAPRVDASTREAARGIARTETLGEPTQAAGLYFLLHVLRRLQIAAAIEACPALSEAGLAAHVLRGIATGLKVPESDPVLLGLGVSGVKFALEKDVLAMLPRAALPGNLPWNGRAFGSQEVLRGWTLAVRRWCWREARMTVREIVERRGAVWMTRADLDVTLPLREADVRIRRVGLDIDPGWVPWLGVHGRVVRFHYSVREGRAAAESADGKETE
jgi:hypothetical protein